jgi:hypothetical protein
MLNRTAGKGWELDGILYAWTLCAGDLLVYALDYQKRKMVTPVATY